MNQRKLIGLNFDGVVVRYSDSHNSQDLAEMPGLRKVLRQICHKGYDVVCVSTREDDALNQARRFLSMWQLKLRVVSLHPNVKNEDKVSPSELLVYASDLASDLFQVKSQVPNLFLFHSSPGRVEQTSPEVWKRVSSHHELITLINKCLPI